MVYDPTLRGERLIFGVSGALYKSSAILYDRQTESLWAQPIRKAVTGRLAGSSLSLIPSRRARWSEWVKEHPHTLVLSPATGHSRDYDTNPYEDYESSPAVMPDVATKESQCKFGAKDRVLGVEVDGNYRAYRIKDLKKRRKVREAIGSRTVEIAYHPESDSASASFEDGSPADSMIIYWFAWHAFHPESSCGEKK